MILPTKIEDGSKKEAAVSLTKQHVAKVVTVTSSSVTDMENITNTEDENPVKHRRHRPRRCWLTRKAHRENVGPIYDETSTIEVGTACLKNQPSNVNSGATAAVEKYVHSASSDRTSCKVPGKILTVAKPLPSLVYEEVAKVSRTMHIVDYEKCVKAGEFISSTIRYSYKTFLPRDGHYVWFRAQNNSVSSETHDWFGNVLCSFDLLEFLRGNQNVNLFYIDCAYFGYSSASRILLTTKIQEPNAKKIDLSSLKYGDPLMFDGEKLLFLSLDVGRTRKWFGTHNTQIVVDANTIDLRNLFEICEKTVVNHSKANKMDRNQCFVQHQCLLYNSRGKVCPSAYTVKDTRDYSNGILNMNNSKP